MIQQLDEHFTREAVEGVPVGKSVAAERALNSRLLLTNKLELQGGWQAKARWIGGGHKDPDAGSIRTSSPTATFWGHQLILWMAAFCGWVLQTGDVSAAFLQGEELEHKIYLRIPTALPAGVLGWRTSWERPTARIWSAQGMASLA